jgi:hypothetical protein
MAVHAIHDGTAAALAHAGSAHRAVIVLGTALGVGFPPTKDDGLCPLTFATPSSDPSIP